MHCQDYRISACSSSGVSEHGYEYSMAPAAVVVPSCNTSHLSSREVVILPTKAPRTLSKFELFRQKHAESKHFSRYLRCIISRNTITVLIGLVAVAALAISIYDLSLNFNRSDRAPPGGSDGMLAADAQPLAHETSSPDSNLLSKASTVTFIIYNATLWSSAAPEVKSHLTTYANSDTVPDAVSSTNSTILPTTTALRKNRSRSTRATTLPLLGSVAISWAIVAYFCRSLSTPQSVTAP